MKTTIDRFGRVVVPKEMRTRLGLTPGAEVDIDEQAQEIVIRQAKTSSPLEIEDGVLVFAGSASGDIASWVRKVRDERALKIGPGA